MKLAVASSILAKSLPASAVDIPEGSSNANVRILRQGRRKLARSRARHFEAPRRDDGKLSVGSPIFERKGVIHTVLKNSRSPDIDTEECDPNVSEDADLGILSCGKDHYCAENKLSSMGGFCMNNESHERRSLVSWLPSDVCVPSSDLYQYYDCDCDAFDAVTEEGFISCIIYEYACFYQGGCGSMTVDASFGPESFEEIETCYSFVAPIAGTLCYRADSVNDCDIEINGQTCSTCDLLAQGGIDAPDGTFNCYDFDCSNTVIDLAGNACFGAYPFDALIYPSDSGYDPTSDPTTAIPSIAPSQTGPSGVPSIGTVLSILPSAVPTQYPTFSGDSSKTSAAPSVVMGHMTPTPSAAPSTDMAQTIPPAPTAEIVSTTPSVAPSEIMDRGDTSTSKPTTGTTLTPSINPSTATPVPSAVPSESSSEPPSSEPTTIQPTTRTTMTPSTSPSTGEVPTTPAPSAVTSEAFSEPPSVLVTASSTSNPTTHPVSAAPSIGVEVTETPMVVDEIVPSPPTTIAPSARLVETDPPAGASASNDRSGELENSSCSSLSFPLITTAASIFLGFLIALD